MIKRTQWLHRSERDTAIIGGTFRTKNKSVLCVEDFAALFRLSLRMEIIRAKRVRVEVSDRAVHGMKPLYVGYFGDGYDFAYCKPTHLSLGSDGGFFRPAKHWLMRNKLFKPRKNEDLEQVDLQKIWIAVEVQ